MDEVVIKVGGMSCQGCVRNLGTALQALPGVAQVEVLLEPGQATVRFDGALLSPERLKATVEDAGFDVL